MTYRFWRVADAVAHFLYCPAMLGRRVVKHHPVHDIHLIPGRALEWVCDRLDLACGLTREDTERR